MERLAELVGAVLEAAALGVILGGAALATGFGVLDWSRRSFEAAYQPYRRRLGRAIILGLEFLVAADIVRTVALDPTFTSIGVLAAIVAVRTFLSLSLEVETEGAWPWRRRRVTSSGGDVERRTDAAGGHE